jgi:DNA polymerase-3 subunit chi
MADIRFHTLSAAGGAARFRHACQLTEQAYLAGERVLVWLDGAADLAQFDQLLWTFGDRAFVPHEPLAAEPKLAEAPVQLHAGSSLDARILDGGFTTLVNLRAAPATEALRVTRNIEVIDVDTACRDAGLASNRFYSEARAKPQNLAIPND